MRCESRCVLCTLLTLQAIRAWESALRLHPNDTDVFGNLVHLKNVLAVLAVSMLMSVACDDLEVQRLQV